MDKTDSAFVTDELFAYCVETRRRIHRRPEVGFDLPETAALVAGELEKYGIPHTERFVTCSVVGYIGNDPDKKTLCLRADMDALPIQEKTDLPFASEIPGKMHACGHDSHTALLLTAGRILHGMEKELPCNVRLLFQPSEEGEVSGAKMMVDHGVMDGADAVLGIHCENTLEHGRIGVRPGGYMAACIPITLRFFGRSAHAAMAETGVDALAMAVESYGKLKELVRREAGADIPYVWNVGSFHAGTAHNAVPDFCEQKISFRYFDQAFAERVMEKTADLCDAIALSYGGRSEVDWHVSAYPVVNDVAVTEQLAQICRAGGLTVEEMPRRMGSEDFCWYLTKAPGAFFRYGSRNERIGCTAKPHNNDFAIDESGMRAGIAALVLFAQQYGG